MSLKDVLTPRFKKDLILSALIIAFMYSAVHNPLTHPKPKPLPGNWSIQFMQHPILFGFAGHNYLLLRDDRGSIISELHGLATDPATGNWKYIGTNKTDLLKVWEFDSSRYYTGEKSFPGIILLQGNGQEIQSRWALAQKCIDPINSKNIPYPPYGFSLRNETTNSNSVAYSLAQCMRVDVRHLGIFTPGSTVNLLP